MEQFLATQTGKIPVLGFLINLLLTAGLSFVLGRLYIAFGASPSNRRAFARNFVLLGMTTMVIITIVKSSLALSLGLVGALSIVRFRAAIKEPEELTYLFLVISLGLGFGADQVWVTLIAFAVVAVVLIAKRKFERTDEVRHLHLTVSSAQPAGLTLAALVGTLEKHSNDLHLTRFDEGANLLEASFKLEFDDYKKLEQATSDIRALNAGDKFTFLNLEDLGN
ncbi:MAG: DUF4956 domain-containing protein [Gemmatimonadetes bacterium]|nr:DUF4956 domain-containing protein [Gemmatimonadota bacterium]